VGAQDPDVLLIIVPNASDGAYKASRTICKSICSNSNFQANSAQHCKRISSIKFVLDSGAIQHMVNDERYFDELKDIDKINISVAKKNESLTAKQQGDILVKTLYKGDSSTKTMKEYFIYQRPKMQSDVRKRGYRVMFKGDYAYALIDNEIKFVANTNGRNGRLYEVMLHE